MKAIYVLCLMLLAASLLPAQEVFSANDPGETPNRTYHVIHYAIKVNLHTATKSVDGTTSITLTPLLSDVQSVEFNAADMKIKRVTIGRSHLATFESTPYTLRVNLGRSYSPRDTLTVSIDYSCTPKEGLTFNLPDAGYPSKRAQIWSQGEDTTNHFWFPCYDHPNDKATSEVIGTVDNPYTLLSNGRLVSVHENKTSKTKTFHWVQDKPHSTYLIMIAAGNFAILHDHVGSLPLEYYVYPDDTTNAWMTFKYTPSMIRFFDKATGYNYAWDKYAQIILQDHFGGMENTSATTLADTWAVPDPRIRSDITPTSLIAHELAHQWFGDLVTCKDWRHLWLNESFASYYDPLWHEQELGRDEFDYMMYLDQLPGIVVDTTQGRKPIVSVNSYGTNIYPRGASVLHMLRFVLGDDAYHRSISHYLHKFQFQPVETNDFKNAIEEETGQNLQWFFDEWIYKAGHPIFDLSSRWDKGQKMVYLSVKQVQTMDSLTGVFKMPVDIEVVTGTGSQTHRVGIVSADTTYAFPCADQPSFVIFDKGNWLLKEMHWDKPVGEWLAQASSAKNPIDRIYAVIAMSHLTPTPEIAEAVADRIEHDHFWGVRKEAVQRAAVIARASEEVQPVLKHALLAALQDGRSAVRVSAAASLGAFKGADVVAGLDRALNDTSYYAIANAIRSIAHVDSAHALPVVSRYLDYPSAQNIVSNAALSSLARLDSTQAVTAALRRVPYGQDNSMRFSSLGIIRRYGKGRSDVLSTLKTLLNDPNERMKISAIRALGDLGDASVLPSLEALVKNEGGGFYLLTSSVSSAATESIKKIKKRMSE